MIHLLSAVIIETKFFDNISISVILLNSIVMVVDGSGDNSNPIFKILDDIFLVLYTFEALLKILGRGFIMG